MYIEFQLELKQILGFFVFFFFVKLNGKCIAFMKFEMKYTSNFTVKIVFLIAVKDKKWMHSVYEIGKISKSTRKTSFCRKK